MLELPDELDMIKSDTEGLYGDNCDCPLARALKRHGVVVGNAAISVGGWGTVDNNNKTVAQYEWEDGTVFTFETIKTGRLIKKVIHDNQFRYQ